MEDARIIDLYWQRNETAIAETDSKYGAYCHAISFNILRIHEDAEECVSDTYQRAWVSMPPERPSKLKIWLGIVARNITVGLWRKNHARKRYDEFTVLPVGVDEVKSLVFDWTLDDVWSFDPADPYHSQHPASRAEVYVSELDVGLSRVKLDDTDFLLIPTLSMHGWKTIYMAGLDLPEKFGSPSALLNDILIIDLRDGSAIKVCNPPDH